MSYSSAEDSLKRWLAQQTRKVGFSWVVPLPNITYAKRSCGGMPSATWRQDEQKRIFCSTSKKKA